MSTLLIGYDLNKPGQDYAELIKCLKSVGTSWWHRLDSTWLIKTSMTPAELRDELRAHMDSGDELLGHRRYRRRLGGPRIQQLQVAARQPLGDWDGAAYLCRCQPHLRQPRRVR